MYMYLYKYVFIYILVSSGLYAIKTEIMLFLQSKVSVKNIGICAKIVRKQ